MPLNNKGLSLVELLVAVGILGISALVVGSTQVMINRELTNSEKVIQSKIESLTGEKLLFFDLQSANVSFNNVLIRDDNSKNFFDYIPDLPISASSNSEPERKITLSTKEGSNKTEIVFLMDDPSLGPVLVYDPSAAYKIGEAPADLNTPASLTFEGLNRKEWIANQRENFWKTAHLLMLDTTARIRSMFGTVDMKVPPRSPIFVGKVNGDNLSADAILKKYLNVTHPETGQEIGDADTFLRTVPSAGGGIPTVRIRAITAIRYSVENTGNNMRLWRTIYSPETGTWERKFLINENLDSVVFERSSVSSKIVTVKMNLIDFK